MEMTRSDKYACLLQYGSVYEHKEFYGSALVSLQELLCGLHRRRQDIQHHDTQHNDTRHYEFSIIKLFIETQHNDVQHSILYGFRSVIDIHCPETFYTKPM
jgi:hypothetical protein